MYRVREEKPIEPWGHWWPEPDLAVVRGPKQRYQGRHPGPADIVLIAEVCETSPQDRTKKLTGYAEAGFPVYWILDLSLRQLEVDSGRAPSRGGAGEYPAAAILAEMESVEVVIDGQVIGRIAVAELLRDRKEVRRDRRASPAPGRSPVPPVPACTHRRLGISRHGCGPDDVHGRGNGARRDGGRQDAHRRPAALVEIRS